MAAFVKDFAQLQSMVNNLQVTGAGCVKMHPDRIEIQVYRSFWPFLSFWYKQTGTNGNTITVKGGTFRVHGKFRADVAEAAITLADTTEYIYLEWTRAGTTVSLGHAGSEPASTNTVMYVPLYRFGLSNYGNAYVLKQIYHVGDVNLDYFASLALPSAPSVLAWDSTGGLHWVELDTKWKVPTRNASSQIVGDWVRFKD